MAGTVVAKTEAERRYEDAITDGDAAVLLEQPQPGLYTASVGNLAPGETATIRFRYGLLLRWNGDLVRFAMPTTIAPRYGDPSAGGLHPHQQPEYGFDAERYFRMRVSVSGVLQGARWTSPSHDVAVTPDGERTVIEIARPAAMDRDCVLEARATVASARWAQLDRDDGDWVALASFVPEIPDLGESGAHRCVKIVVDCSGSMSGDSIEQVRVAGERILDSLRPGNLFDIVAFGSHHRVLFGRATSANRTNVARAREFVLDLDADLGGTEIASALRAAYRIESDPRIPRDLLLITDGEVWDTDSTVAEARASGHRIFSVGVGSAVAEPFVRALAGATGGACELVTPREKMAARIHRHFERILAPPAKRARVIWPAPVRHAVPDPLPPPHPGDTLHLFGSFAERPEGSVVLELELADGCTVSHRLELGAPPRGSVGVEGASGIRSDLARMGAARRLPAIGEAAAAELAVRYQLVSEWTDCLVVHVRADADKAAELPSLVKVPQVVAAGWHGIGTVHDASPVGAAAYGEVPPPTARSSSERVPGPSRLSPVRGRLCRRAAQAADMEPLLDVVAPVSPGTINSPAELVAVLNHCSLPAVPTLEELAALGTPDEIVAGLRALVDGGEDARAVAVIFLSLVCESSAGNGFDRQRRRLILSAYKQLRPRAAAVGAVRRVWQDWDAICGATPAGP